MVSSFLTGFPTQRIARGRTDRNSARGRSSTAALTATSRCSRVRAVPDDPNSTAGCLLERGVAGEGDRPPDFRRHRSRKLLRLAPGPCEREPARSTPVAEPFGRCRWFRQTHTRPAPRMRRLRTPTPVRSSMAAPCPCEPHPPSRHRIGHRRLLSSEDGAILSGGVPGRLGIGGVWEAQMEDESK